MAVVPGAVIRCRPIVALLMQDAAGMDEKVLAVPVADFHPFYSTSVTLPIAESFD